VRGNSYLYAATGSPNSVLLGLPVAGVAKRGRALGQDGGLSARVVQGATCEGTWHQFRFPPFPDTYLQ